MNRYRQEIVTNAEPVQAPDSELCGEMVIFYALHKLAALNEPIGEIIDDCFTRDLSDNDVVVKRFLAEMLQEAQHPDNIDRQ